jgi:predicted naringenin-chalcone synthase
MSFAILGIGTASPARRIAQADAARLAAGFANAEPGGERALAAIYRQTKIRSRGSVLLEDPGDDAFAQSFFPPAATATEVGPSTGERMARYAAEAGPLAIAAAGEALADAAVAAGDVTHLVTCSCTGFANPGVDLELVAALGLRPGVARTHVGFMGCHGAFNALRVAAALAAQDPAGVVLVACVELCSLHFQYGARSDLVVANSIFADGAAAVVGRAADAGIAAAGRGWRLERQWSRIIPESGDDMGWTIGDHGFEMNLSARVPAIIGRELPGILAEVIADVGLAPADVGSWAVHPGGPRVLAATAESLGLDRDALAASWDVLAGHGNMSSATILFILDRLLRVGPRDAAGPVVALAFGPGLTVEAALFGR